MTRADAPERLRFRSFAAVLKGRSQMAARLQVGAVVAWAPLSTLCALTRRAVERAELGDAIDPCRIEEWKADELGLRAAPDPAQPGLFGGPADDRA